MPALPACNPHQSRFVGIVRVYRDVIIRCRKWSVNAKSETSLDLLINNRSTITLHNREAHVSKDLQDVLRSRREGKGSTPTQKAKPATKQSPVTNPLYCHLERSSNQRWERGWDCVPQPTPWNRWGSWRSSSTRVAKGLCSEWSWVVGGLRVRRLEVVYGGVVALPGRRGVSIAAANSWWNDKAICVIVDAIAMKRGVTCAGSGWWRQKMPRTWSWWMSVWRRSYLRRLARKKEIGLCWVSRQGGPITHPHECSSGDEACCRLK